MRSSTRNFDVSRDPVCVRIEEFLNDLSTSGADKLERENTASGVVVRFGRMQADSVNYDIALVRLAMQLLDAPEYGARIREVLSREMQSQAA
jgi:hypothetical protein